MYFYTLANTILKAKRVLLITHPNPDADAVGSVSAMTGYCQSLNKSCLAFYPDPLPFQLRSIPWANDISNNISDLSLFCPDVIIVLDFSDKARFARLGITTFLASLPRRSYQFVIIDHHVDTDLEADIRLVDTRAVSTTEILVLYFQFIKFPLNSLVSESLLAGLLGDTENFTNSCITPRSIEVAANLVRNGVSISRLAYLSSLKNVAELRLFGLALARLSFNEKYRVAYTVIRKEDSGKLGVENNAIGGLSNYLKRLGKKYTILVLCEHADGYVTGSFRSVVSSINVAKLAKFFGGGGHVQAAGFRIKGRLERSNGYWKIV